MPSGSNAFWVMAPPIRRGLAAVLLNAGAAIYVAGIAGSLAEGIGARAREGGRIGGGAGPRSIDCAKQPLVFPDDADHHALDDDVALIQPQRLHFVVGRLQPDPPAGLAVKTASPWPPSPLTRAITVLAGLGLVAFLNDDVVAVLDVLVDHRVAAHLEHVAAPRVAATARRATAIVSSPVIASIGARRRRPAPSNGSSVAPVCPLGGTTSIARLSLCVRRMYPLRSRLVRCS